MSTQEQAFAVAAEWKEKYAPKGLEVDLTPNGELNGQIISTFLQNNKLSFTAENLTKAVESEKHRFVWQPGFGPNVAATPAPKGSRFNQLADAGVRMSRAEGDSHSERFAEAARAKEDAERQREAAIAKQKEIDLARQQHAEETQILYRESGPRKGEVDHARTAAAQRAAKEKWASIRGVPTKPSNYRIPLYPTREEFVAGSPAELRVWNTDRRKAGLPTSISW